MKQDYEKIITQIDLTKLNKSNILITGANGLIGGFLADLFLYLNDTYNFNIKLTLTSLSKTPNRIKHLIDRDDVTYISLDLSKDKLTLKPSAVSGSILKPSTTGIKVCAGVVTIQRTLV